MCFTLCSHLLACLPQCARLLFVRYQVGVVLQATAEAPSVKLLPVPLYVLYTHLSMVCSETPACSAFSVSIEGSFEDAMAVAGSAVEVGCCENVFACCARCYHGDAKPLFCCFVRVNRAPWPCKVDSLALCWEGTHCCLGSVLVHVAVLVAARKTVKDNLLLRAAVCSRRCDMDAACCLAVCSCKTALHFACISSAAVARCISQVSQSPAKTAPPAHAAAEARLTNAPSAHAAGSRGQDRQAAQGAHWASHPC